MEENKVFKNIKRVNTLILLGIGLFALYWIVAVFVADFGGYEQKGRLNANNELVVQPNQMDLQFGTQLSGLDLYTVSLKLDGDYSGGSFSKGYSPDRRINYAVYSATTGKTRWFFPNNNQLIFTTQILAKDEQIDSDEKMRIATAHLLTLADADTNGDGGLSKEDDVSVWLFSPDGSDGRKLIEKISDDIKFEYIDSDKALVFYKTKDGMYVAKLDIISRQILSTDSIELP